MGRNDNEHINPESSADSVSSTARQEKTMKRTAINHTEQNNSNSDGSRSSEQFAPVTDIVAGSGASASPAAIGMQHHHHQQQQQRWTGNNMDGVSSSMYQQQQQQQQQQQTPFQLYGSNMMYMQGYMQQGGAQSQQQQQHQQQQYSQFLASQTEKKKRRRFTKEEDELILEAIPRFENAKGGVDWDELRKEINIDRTKEQIRTRYSRIKAVHHQRLAQSQQQYQQRLQQQLSQTKRLNNTDVHAPMYSSNSSGGSSNSSGGNSSGAVDGAAAAAGGGGAIATHSNSQPHVLDHQQGSRGSIGSSSGSSNDQQQYLQYHAMQTNSHSNGSHSGGGFANDNDEPSSKKQKTLHVYQHQVFSGTSPAIEGSSERNSFTQTEVNFDEIIRRLQQEIKEKTERIGLLEQRGLEYQQQATKLDLMLKSESQKSEAMQQKHRFVLEQLVREKSERERREELNRLKEKTLHIGNISYERKGLEVFEVWQDGDAFQSLEKQFQKFQEEKESLERSKKNLSKRKANLKKSGQENLDELFYINEQEEVMRIRQNLLKKNEAALNEEKRKLLIDKSQVIREIKRNRDQDRSRFNNFPVIQGRYLLMKMLGRGGFSEVYKAYDLQELRIVACKVHQLNVNWKEHRKENYIKHVLRECQIHKSIRHERVVQMFDTFILDNNTFVTVLEFCEGSDLDMHIKTYQRIPEKEARNIIGQVFSGLKYLNTGTDKKIIHFDLKPANIMYNHGEIKITDFGLSKIMEEEDAIELTSQGAGTYWYLPPECFEMGTIPKISSKVDVWSAGVVFYQMLYGKKPFGNELSQQKILTEQTIINARNVQFPPRPAVSEDAKEFIRRCLTHDQARRPDVLQASLDPYLRGDLSRLKQSFSSHSSSSSATIPIMQGHPLSFSFSGGAPFASGPGPNVPVPMTPVTGASQPQSTSSSISPSSNESYQRYLGGSVQGDFG